MLDALCGANALLRPEVESLLKANDEVGGFLADLGRVMVPADMRVGQVIGRYKLLQQIGEGGFGIVYMAEQQHPVRRQVALKVIKPGMDSGVVIARFEAERQALAMMDHPNITKVLNDRARVVHPSYPVLTRLSGFWP